MKKLFIEAWVLLFLISEVLFINWMLLHGTNMADSHTCKDDNDDDDDDDDSNAKGPTRVWKKYDKLSCTPVEMKDLKTMVSSPPSTDGFFVYSRQHNQGHADVIVAGISIRIARSVAQRQYGTTGMCALSWQTDTANFSSFRWTMVGDPTDQAINHFFRESASRRQLDPHDSVIRRYVMKQYDGSLKHHLRLVDDKRQGPPRGMEQEVVQQVLNAYDFIGISERFEESMVVLKLLLGMDLRDVSYLFNPSPFELYDDDRCYYQIQRYKSPGMTKFFESTSWQNMIQGDALLHQAANASLDRTIHKLGRQRVHSEVEEYRQLIKTVQDQCHTNHPCSPNGVRNHASDNSCYLSGIGCGHDCIDKLSLYLP